MPPEEQERVHEQIFFVGDLVYPRVNVPGPNGMAMHVDEDQILKVVGIRHDGEQHLYDLDDDTERSMLGLIPAINLPEDYNVIPFGKQQITDARTMLTSVGLGIIEDQEQFEEIYRPILEHAIRLGGTIEFPADENRAILRTRVAEPILMIIRDLAEIYNRINPLNEVVVMDLADIEEFEDDADDEERN
jgi:hypothetical protein